MAGILGTAITWLKASLGHRSLFSSLAPVAYLKSACAIFHHSQVLTFPSLAFSTGFYLAATCPLSGLQICEPESAFVLRFQSTPETPTLQDTCLYRTITYQRRSGCLSQAYFPTASTVWITRLAPLFIGIY